MKGGKQMPLNITNFIFTSEVLNHLDMKYTKNLNLDFNKVFLYSNILDLPLIYGAGSNKTDYNIYNKLHHEYHYNLILNLIDFIKSQRYLKNHILFLYGSICNLILNDHLNNFFKEENKELRIKEFDFYYGLKNNIDLSNNKLCNIFPKSFILTFNDYDIINEMLNKTYSFSLGEKLYKVSLKKYKQVLKSNGLNKLRLRILDIFSKNIKYSYYMYPTKNKKSAEEIDFIANDLEFNQLIKKALEESIKLINICNQALFYKNDKELNLYFQK